MAFEMALPFEPDTEDFVHGFECGRIWTLMSENPYALTGLIFHAVNAEMVMRMLEKKGLNYTVEFTDDETWMRFTDDK
jgi:hypothetical protein